MKEKDWRRRVLAALGAPATPQNLQFLSTWQRWEGGHTKNNAKYNWLNTTHGPGSSINEVGVKRFSDFKTGVQSTVQTLRNGRYNNIVSGLKSGNPYETPGVEGDLQTWVSGKRDGNPAYASKILGGPGVPGGSGAPLGRTTPGPAGPGADLLAARKQFAFSLLQGIGGALQGQPMDMSGLISLAQARMQAEAAQQAYGPANYQVSGKGINPGTSWKGTHVTDGLGWGTKTAADIMGKPGTPVQAPVGGVIKYFKPQGAQGGGSMLLIGDDGKQYWLGHIANGVRAGTRVEAGQPIAVISGDHKAPHLHIDAR